MKARGGWCCPVCGTLNDLDGEYSRAGYCQGDRCVDVRAKLVRRGWWTWPEIIMALSKTWVDA